MAGGNIFAMVAKPFFADFPPFFRPYNAARLSVLAFPIIGTLIFL